MSSPVKQKEYRLPDGRKRIIPEAVGVTAHQERMSVSDQSEALEWPIRSIGQNNNGNEVIHINSGAREGLVQKAISGSAVHRERPGVTAWATISESLVIEKVPASVSKGGGGDVERIGCVVSGSNLLIRVFDKNQGETLPVCLEAHPREHAVNDILGAGNACTIKETELSCTKGSQNLWSDRISGKVTVLAGNSDLWVVGCEDGSLQVYTKCGRRAMPTMMMGSAAVFIDCDESWKLMLVTRMGSLYVWDLFNRECLLHDSLVSLINTDLKSNSKDTGTMKVISAKLAKSGSPLVVLATRHAYLFDMSLKCWLRVADDCFPASNFASSWNLGSLHGGELAALQVDVRKFQARKPGWTRVTDDGMQTRAHLEALLASALALRSPCEYRQCLLSYIHFLAREADESRLREVCESFLGPPIGMTESASDLKSPAWDPLMLGMDKHKLLREYILPAMASNRKVQRLLNEFMDLLSEYETVKPNIKQKNLTPEPPLPPTDKMDLDTPALDKPKSDSVLATTQTNTIERAVPGVDHSSQTTDQTDTVSSAPSQVPDSISEDTNPVQTWSTPSEQMDLDPPA